MTSFDKQKIPTPCFLFVIQTNKKALKLKASRLFCYSFSILNIRLSIPTMDFGALTTTTFTKRHLHHISISTPSKMSRTHSTNTRKPDGNKIPRRMPAAIAITHRTKPLPLLLHISKAPSSPFLCYILRKRRVFCELSTVFYFFAFGIIIVLFFFDSR